MDKNFKKDTHQKTILDKIELLFLLNEIKINQDYRNKKISEHEFKYLKYKIELMKNKLEKYKNSKKFESFNPF